MLDVHIARKRFDAVPDRIVLRDIAFSIAPGEVIALLGPSGIGKSTLLRILLGLDSVFEGQVRRSCRRMSVAFQEPRLLPWLTVADNIRVVMPTGARRPDIAGLLRTVQLGDVGALRPRQLSLGMARRVALARALAIEPDVLVLDEPFASLDAQLAAGLFASIAQWARSTGATVLAATHDLSQALNHVSRLLILSGVPASLCADVAVSANDTACLQASLLAQFPFLDSARNPILDPAA